MGGAGRLDERLDGVQWLGVDVACIPRALRAEVAVFGAAPALGVEEDFDARRVADVARAYVVRQPQQIRDLARWKGRERRKLQPARRAAALDQRLARI
jgi:hypothetical protein